MKKKRFIAAVMAGILMVGSICSQTAQAASKWPKGPDKKSLSCASAIVMELSTGTVLYSKNVHQKHYPASITKIMTSLLTLENSSPSDVVTFTEAEAHGIETGSSSMYCVPGEKFTIEQVLYGIMLQSANEMCLVAADHVAGSVSAFVDMMNERVAQLGLKDTIWHALPERRGRIHPSRRSVAPEPIRSSRPTSVKPARSLADSFSTIIR